MLTNASINDLQAMYDLWEEMCQEESYYKYLSFSQYQDKIINSFFSWDNVFLIKKENHLISYALVYLINNKAYLNMIIVKKEYRNQGIATSLLNDIENHYLNLGISTLNVSYFLPICYDWYIPNTDKHDHPCAPGIRINSAEYFFLLHRGYITTVYSDAFHLELSNYQISPKIQKILDDNEKDNIKIEIYDPNKHYGLEDFYKQLNIPDFEKVIRSNLELEKSYPFLVVAENNKIVGWTGAMWNEESGRGHFDGIAILDSVRNRGLGKALFSLLAYYSKQNKAKFMTFYTGLNNYARYIYMGAGFKIIQSFVFMKKELKK